MKRYALFALDVSGNEKDGYEVNDYYQQALYIEAEELPSFDKVVSILKKAGFLKKRFRYEEQYPYEEMVCIEYKGCPLFNLRETQDDGAGTFLVRSIFNPQPAQIYRVHPSRTVRIQ